MMVSSWRQSLTIVWGQPRVFTANSNSRTTRTLPSRSMSHRGRTLAAEVFQHDQQRGGAALGRRASAALKRPQTK